MGSSRSTRNTLRATAGSEIVGTSVGTFFPASAIPIKFTQALGAFSMFIHESEGSLRDRGLLLFQGVLASTQLVLASILFFGHTTCDSSTLESLCVASFYLMLVYHGTLLTGWGLSEVIRQPICVAIEGSSGGASSGGVSGDGSMHSMARIPYPSTTDDHSPSFTGNLGDAVQRTQVPNAQYAGILSPTPISDDTPDPSVASGHTVVSMLG